MNRIVFFTRFVILFFSFSLGALSLLHTPQLPCSKSDCLVYLASLEQAAWHKLEKLGIEKAFLQKEKSLYKKSTEKIDIEPEIEPLRQETIAFIQNIMRDFGLDPSTIQIKGTNGLVGTSGDYVIYINQEKLNRISESARSFVIAHELQHIIYRDCLSDWFMNQHLSQAGPAWQEKANAQHPYYEYSRFLETRADILASLKSKIYAQGYVEFMEFVISLGGDDEALIHPKLEDRLKLAQNILKYVYSHEESTSIKTCTLPSIKDDYPQYLHDLENDVWQKLEQLGVTKPECEILAKQYQKADPKSDKGDDLEVIPLHKQTIGFIQNIIKDFGIDPKKISIKATSGHEAFAADDTIFVDEIRFNKLSIAARAFVIAHELQHILYEDCFMDSAVHHYLSKIDPAWQEKANAQHPYYEYSRFLETRADILAAIKGGIYAQGYREFIEFFINSNAPQPGPNHPSDKDRLTIAHDILKTVYNQEYAAC